MESVSEMFQAMKGDPANLLCTPPYDQSESTDMQIRKYWNQ